MANTSEVKRLIERPFWWAVFAVAVVVIPLVGFLVESSLTWDEIHPAINALLNASCAVFLVVGWSAIKAGNIELHKRCMLTAFATSATFLISYLVRFYLSGSHRYPGTGWDRHVYLVILFSHMALAVVVLPMVLRSLFLGLKGRYAAHRSIARVTWPIWVYVSVTGLLVYLMLYPIAGRLYD
jgi:uncharacterized membrane protein YozB (DUF420 family)